MTRARAQSAGGLVALCTLAIVAAGAASAALTTKTFGHAARLKGTKVWYVQGTAVTPKALSVKVAPVPSQPVKVQWSVVCQRTNPTDPADHIGARVSSGQTSVGTATIVKLALPFAKPPSCVATVYATLSRNGVARRFSS